MSINFEDNIYFGSHMSKEGTYTATIQKVLATPFSVVQIFLSNCRSYELPKIDIDDMIQARELIRVSKLKVYVHGNLLYNLCGCTDKEKTEKYFINREKIKRNLVRELDICAFMGGRGVVVHIGSCKDREAGIERIAELVIDILDSDVTISQVRKEDRVILLENCAGEGTKIGKNIEEIDSILEKIPNKYKKNIGICFDTAHSFGAGIYHFGKVEEVDRFIQETEHLDIRLIHLNDSKVGFNSRKDRHEVYLDGMQFNRGSLKYFIDKMIEKKIDMASETPDTRKDYEVICSL